MIRSIFFVVLAAILVAFSHELEAEKDNKDVKSSGEGSVFLDDLERRAAADLIDSLSRTNVDEEEDVDVDTRDLLENEDDLLSLADDDTEETEKRSVRDCVGLGDKCNLFKHCCGNRLKCHRRRWRWSGTCQLKLRG